MTEFDGGMARVKHGDLHLGIVPEVLDLAKGTARFHIYHIATDEQGNESTEAASTFDLGKKGAKEDTTTSTSIRVVDVFDKNKLDEKAFQKYVECDDCCRTCGVTHTTACACAVLIPCPPGSGAYVQCCDEPCCGGLGN